jgi:MFS family permease
MRLGLSPERQYFLYSATFNGARAYVNSTAILYLVDVAKLPLAATAILLAADLFATMLAEVPTGVYADRVGRHKSFVLACALTFLGFGTYALLPWLTAANGSTSSLVLLAVLAEILGSIGFAFQSGALDAWVVERLRANGRNSDIGQTLAHGQAAKNLAYMAAGILGIGHYYLISPTQPLLSTFATAAGILLALTAIAVRQDTREHLLPNTAPNVRTQSIALQLKHSTSILGDTWAELLANKKLLALIIAGSASYTLLQLIAFYWPYFLTKEVLNSDTGAGTLLLTVSWLVGYGLRALGNYAATFLVTRPTRTAVALGASVVASSGFTITLCLLAGFITSRDVPFAIAVLATLLYGLVRLSDGVADPMRQWLIADAAANERLATMYSLASTISLCVSSAAAAAAAYLLDHGTTVTALLASAAIFQLLSTPLYLYAARR